MSKEAEFRKRAEECVLQAHQTTGSQRLVLLQMAQKWVQLADQEANLTALLGGTTPEKKSD